MAPDPPPPAESLARAEHCYRLGLLETAAPPRLALELYARAALLLARALSDLGDDSGPRRPDPLRARQRLQQAHAVLIGLIDLLNPFDLAKAALVREHEALAARLSAQFRHSVPECGEIRAVLTELHHYRHLWEEALAIRRRPTPALNVRRADGESR